MLVDLVVASGEQMALRVRADLDGGVVIIRTAQQLMADGLVEQASPPVCARHTVGQLLAAAPAFSKWAADEPASAALMARGLQNRPLSTASSPCRTSWAAL
mgnify:CR=1 FL=1